MWVKRLVSAMLGSYLSMRKIERKEKGRLKGDVNVNKCRIQCAKQRLP